MRTSRSTSAEHERFCWIDGALQDRAAPAVRADDSAFAEGRGCYTTALWTGRGVRWLERHVARLCGDARALALGAVDPDAARAALEELGRAAFGDGEGVVRLQASRDGDGRLHLVGVPRALGREPDAWRAIVAPFPHEGPTPVAGAKVSNRLLHALAREAARAAGADEALLLDAAGRLVEGSRSNVCVAGADGTLVTPRRERGAVAGVALGVVAERVPELRVRDVDEPELRRATEIVALNAVRGARPVVTLDGRAVGRGRPGAWARRLAEALASD